MLTHGVYDVAVYAEETGPELSTSASDAPSSASSLDCLSLIVESISKTVTAAHQQVAGDVA